MLCADIKAPTQWIPIPGSLNFVDTQTEGLHRQRLPLPTNRLLPTTSEPPHNIFHIHRHRRTHLQPDPLYDEATSADQSESRHRWPSWAGHQEPSPAIGRTAESGPQTHATAPPPPARTAGRAARERRSAVRPKRTSTSMPAPTHTHDRWH